MEMPAAAAAWGVLEKAANVAQMFTMLVAVFTSLLRIQQRNRQECARLERRHSRLHALLQWSATGGGSGVALLLCSEVGDPFGKALGDAAGLVNSYKKSTFWHRLWSGSRMATQLRDMHDLIDSYCGLLLFINAQLMLQQQQAVHPHHPIPPSPDTSTTIHEVNGTSQSPRAQAVTSCPAVTGTRDSERANDVGQGGIDTDPAGCERNVFLLICCLY